MINPAMSRIRPIAICVFRQAEKILVIKYWDHVKQEVFYRPLGGGIEFGETGRQAIVREIAEEIGARVTNVRYLFTLENIFTCNGKSGHEIVLVFEGNLVDPDLYTQETIEVREDSGESFLAIWKNLSDFGPAGDILYPDGLLSWLISN
jgi:8-oxo-dGTP pyrophosphatase MutT (NUDIX family)